MVHFYGASHNNVVFYKSLPWFSRLFVTVSNHTKIWYFNTLDVLVLGDNLVRTSLVVCARYLKFKIELITKQPSLKIISQKVFISLQFKRQNKIDEIWNEIFGKYRKAQQLIILHFKRQLSPNIYWSWSTIERQEVFVIQMRASSDRSLKVIKALQKGQWINLVCLSTFNHKMRYTQPSKYDVSQIGFKLIVVAGTRRLYIEGQVYCTILMTSTNPYYWI